MGEKKNDHARLGDHVTEAELIAAARTRSEDAFSQLYTKHLPYVRAVGRAILHTSDLDDICQETFLLAFTRIDSFQQNSNFRTWITRIAMNQCLMVLRRSRQITNGESQLLRIDEEMAGDDMLDQCIFVLEDKDLTALPARIDLPKLLRVLKPLQRKILEMAYLDDVADQEIANRLGMTLASVKSTIHHAKKRVREVHKKR
jgi:RNA polymerase sigma-70 factor (ECF subfamily)